MSLKHVQSKITTNHPRDYNKQNLDEIKHKAEMFSSDQQVSLSDTKKHTKNNFYKFFIFIAISCLSTACTQTTPEEILGEERITLDEASAQVADAVKRFRLRLASDAIGQDSTKPIVPQEYRSGLMFCGVDINFLVSAKATETGKLTLAVPATLNFAGAGPLVNTVAPTLNAERGGTADASRSNTITFKMVNPVCAGFDKIVAMVQAKPDIDLSTVLEEIRAAGAGNQTQPPQ